MPPDSSSFERRVLGVLPPARTIPEPAGNNGAHSEYEHDSSAASSDEFDEEVFLNGILGEEERRSLDDLQAIAMQARATAQQPITEAVENEFQIQEQIREQLRRLDEYGIAHAQRVTIMMEEEGPWEGEEYRTAAEIIEDEDDDEDEAELSGYGHGMPFHDRFDSPLALRFALFDQEMFRQEQLEEERLWGSGIDMWSL